MTRATISIFARPPLPGRTKARLAAAVGSERAAALAYALLADTIACVGRLSRIEALLSVTEAFDSTSAPGLTQWVQPAGDLGERLEWTLRRALRRSPWAVALGADTPGLSPAMLEAALACLEDHDAVVGPTEDGGFYLLGLKACPKGLLAGIRWSHPRTRSDTAASLQAAGMSLGYAEPWFDLDTVADLRRVLTLLDSDAFVAPHLASAVRQWARAALETPSQGHPDSPDARRHAAEKA